MITTTLPRKNRKPNKVFQKMFCTVKVSSRLIDFRALKVINDLDNAWTQPNIKALFVQKGFWCVSLLILLWRLKTLKKRELRRLRDKMIHSSVNKNSNIFWCTSTDKEANIAYDKLINANILILVYIMASKISSKDLELDDLRLLLHKRGSYLDQLVRLFCEKNATRNASLKTPLIDCIIVVALQKSEEVYSPFVKMKYPPDYDDLPFGFEMFCSKNTLQY